MGKPFDTSLYSLGRPKLLLVEEGSTMGTWKNLQKPQKNCNFSKIPKFCIFQLQNAPKSRKTIFYDFPSFFKVKNWPKFDFCQKTTEAFSQKSVWSISRKWVNLQFLSLISHIFHLWHRIFVSQPNSAFPKCFSDQTSSVAFVAFVAFWGNTMLFFEKFMKNRIFFIPWSLSQLKQNKNYKSLKFR